MCGIIKYCIYEVVNGMDEEKIKITKRIARVVDTDAYRVFLLVFFIALFSWPYMSFLDNTSYIAPFTYLFAVWALLIAILMIGSVTKSNDESIKNND